MANPRIPARDAAYKARSDFPEGSRTEPGEKPIITSYDFVHPARVNKAQLRTLENLHDNFARLLSSTLSSQLQMVVDADTAYVDQTTYREFIDSLSNPSCSYQFSLGPTGGSAIIDITLPVVFGYIDRKLGGKGSSQGVAPRQLSQTEMSEIAQFVKVMVQDLEATWEPISRVEISQIELETNPSFMQIVPPGEIVILLAFEINAAHLSGLISLCYPFLTLQSLLPLLTSRDYMRSTALSDEELALQNRLRLGPAPLAVSAQIGSAELTVEEAGRLRIGDVIRSNSRTSDPLAVLIEGQPAFLGRPFAAEDGTQMIEIAGD